MIDYKMLVMFLIGTLLGVLTYLADMFQNEVVMGWGIAKKIVYVLSFSVACGMVFLVIYYGLNDFINLGFRLLVHTMKLDPKLLEAPIKLDEGVAIGVAGTIAAFLIKIREWLDLFMENKKGLKR